MGCLRAIFIRHGQSTGNIDLPSTDVGLFELTNLGWQQAKEVANSWTEVPSLIVTSPFLRARQTSQPTCERFHAVPVETWPVQEFSYLEPGRWNGTVAIQRQPYVDAYWQRADPAYLDGPGAETFSGLLRRVENALQKLALLPENARVLVFSHGQFMQAVRLTLKFPAWTDKEKMDYFLPFESRSPIRNGQKMQTQSSRAGWHLADDPEPLK